MSSIPFFHTACPSCECLSLVDPQELDASGGRIVCPDCGLRYRAEEHWVELMDYRPRRKTLFSDHGQTIASPGSGDTDDQVPVFGEHFEKNDKTETTELEPPSKPEIPTPPASKEQGNRAPAFQPAFGNEEIGEPGDYHETLSIPGMINTSKLKEEFHFLGTEAERSQTRKALEEASEDEELESDSSAEDLLSVAEMEEPPTRPVKEPVITYEEEAPTPPARKTHAPTPRAVKTLDTSAAHQPVQFRATFEQPVDPDRPRRLTTRGGPNRHLETEREEKSSLADLTAPVEMETDDSQPLWRRYLPLAGSAFLIFLLSVQYVLFHAAEMQRSGNMSWMTSLACTVVSCDPSEGSGANDYQSRLLQIRSHPDTADALQVIFAFSNVSGREVPFPNVELVFFARDNRTVVASRRFFPYEYLPRDSARPEIMPSGTQMQAELNIADPGPDAVNYIIRFSR